MYFDASFDLPSTAAVTEAGSPTDAVKDAIVIYSALQALERIPWFVPALSGVQGYDCWGGVAKEEKAYAAQ